MTRVTTGSSSVIFPAASRGRVEKMRRAQSQKPFIVAGPVKAAALHESTPKIGQRGNASTAASEKVEPRTRPAPRFVCARSE